MHEDGRLAAEETSDFRAERGFLGEDDCADCSDCRCIDDCEAAGGYPDWPEESRGN